MLKYELTLYDNNMLLSYIYQGLVRSNRNKSLNENSEREILLRLMGGTKGKGQIRKKRDALLENVYPKSFFKYMNIYSGTRKNLLFVSHEIRPSNFDLFVSVGRFWHQRGVFTYERWQQRNVQGFVGSGSCI